MKFYAQALIWIITVTSTLAHASVTVTVNGSNHTIPQTNEKGWGTNVTAWIQAISQYTLQNSGGTFTLTADTDFGANFGLASTYYKSRSTNLSTSGILRMAVGDSIGWRNNANGGNLLLAVDGSDNLTFNGVILPSATSASVQDSTFRIYDNGDATKKIAFEASGITTGTTRTLTVPDTDMTLAGTASTQTLTNKTIDAASNTISNISNTEIKSGAAIAYSKINLSTSIVNGDVSASAAIARSKLATGSTNRLVVNDGSTGAMTDAAAITASRALVSDSNGVPTHSTVTSTELGYVSGATSSLQTQINAITSSASRPYEIQNCSITASVASSALTIALKDASGADASGGSPCKISFRNATAATGTYTEVSTTAALSFTVSNGSALGCTASAACTVYVYGVYTGSAVVLGTIGLSPLDEGTVQTSTAEGGAGAADSVATLYTTAAQTSKPVRLLGRLTVTPGASFAWSAAPTEIANVPFRPMSKAPTIQKFTSGSGTYTTPLGVSYLKVTVIGGGGGGGSSGTGSTSAGTGGGTSTFGTSLITCNGGSGGGVGNSQSGGAGGAASITTSSTVLQVAATSGGGGGAAGFGNSSGAGTLFIGGGVGGSSALGGGGAGITGGAGGGAGATNSGAGGAGAGTGGTSSSIAASGGGAGGYAVAIITSPLASYAYAVGALGGGASAGTSGNGGGSGAAGLIIVEEYY